MKKVSFDCKHIYYRKYALNALRNRFSLFNFWSEYCKQFYFAQKVFHTKNSIFAWWCGQNEYCVKQFIALATMNDVWSIKTNKYVMILKLEVIHQAIATIIAKFMTANQWHNCKFTLWKRTKYSARMFDKLSWATITFFNFLVFTLWMRSGSVFGKFFGTSIKHIRFK